MPLVQRLRGYFTRMVYAHQAGRMRFFRSAEFSFRYVARGIFAGCLACRCGNCAQCIVDAGKQAIERRELSGIHGA